MIHLIFFILLSTTHSAQAIIEEAIFQPNDFPKTFNDIPFSEQIKTLAEDYEELLDLEFDENGHCIRGCSYPGITIQQQTQISETDTQHAIQELEAQGCFIDNTKPCIVNTPTQKNITQTPTEDTKTPDTKTTQTTITTKKTETPDTNTTPKTTQTTITTKKTKTASCTSRNESIPVGQNVPIGNPISGKPRITSKFGYRKVNGKPGYHVGIDFGVSTGTKIYTPADGTVLKVFTDSKCGKGITIQHQQNYITSYCHLSKHLVKKGEFVQAGCLIGLSGNTGNSTGPHLHYGIKKDGKRLDPIKFLKL